VEDALAWLLWPMKPQTFFEEYWEKKPLHLRRGKPGYYKGIFSKADIDRQLKGDSVFPYGQRLNLVRFDPSTRKKIDLNGPKGTNARPSDVETAWRNGASMQVMHPQHWHEPCWRLVGALERGFGALFGSNAYLTPPGCQGLAPHYDDVEVFMLQMEGSKSWRLHAPPTGEEYPLPRDYSRDFEPAELDNLLLDCILEAGDLLYLPRGTVHHGVTPEGPAFSHHLTVSTYQRIAWCNIIERAMSAALERASVESKEFREGVPVGFLNFMGSWHENAASDGAASVSTTATVGQRRAAFKRRFRNLCGRLQEYVDVDEICDELGVDFMSQRLPPAVRSEATAAAPKDGTGEALVSLETRVRWLDTSALRALITNDPESSELTVMLFHSCANDQSQHMCRAVDPEEDVGCLRYEAAVFLPGLRMLCKSGNTYVRCGDLPLAQESDRIALCENLLEAGVVERDPTTLAASSASLS
jgi:lysine-specific demethylase/histidyl-hydroxylase NO66